MSDAVPVSPDPQEAKWVAAYWQHIGPCGDCGGPAYYCEGPHGSATWAIHCRDVVRHNAFSNDPVSS